jgi:hypothetical protein
MKKLCLLIPSVMTEKLLNGHIAVTETQLHVQTVL